MLQQSRNKYAEILMDIKKQAMITEEIQKTLYDYFAVLYTQDLETFDRLFHPSCVLYTIQNGSVVVRPLAEYREIVKNRKSPKELNSLRNDEILAIDVLSSDIVFAKVRLRLNDIVITDHLNLLKGNGKWTIASKLYLAQKS
jgi:Putative lumazine-binding